MRPLNRYLLTLLGSAAVAASAAAQTSFELVHAFRRAGSPMGSLIQADEGGLYGVTYWGGKTGVGSVFRVEPGGVPATLHSFAFADGANPVAGLAQASDGAFYGTTTAGGEYNLGTVFRIDASGDLTTLHSFQGFVDGSYPAAALVEASDGNLYGTTSEGGSGAQGTIFRIDSAGQFTSLHSFVGSEGQAPLAALIQASDGYLYGAAALGGTHGVGVVFRMDLAGTFTKLIDLPVEYWNPVALLQGADGKLYGVSRAGGASGAGAVFRLETSGTGLTTFYSFNGLQGRTPVGLVQRSDGTFVGATMGDGPSGYGTVFEMDALLQVTTLLGFGWSDGAYPAGAPLLTADGSIYGVTLGGGGFSSEGTVYGRFPDGVRWLHTFVNPDGVSPQVGLAEGQDGNLYGTTPGGGPGGQGTIFRIGPGGSFRTLHAFAWGEPGAAYGPVAPLVRGSDGFVYGTTAQGGALGGGTLFRLDAAGALDRLYDFDIDQSGYPIALVEGPPGTFYGILNTGFEHMYGSAFRFDLANGFTSLYGFTPGDGTGPLGFAVGTDGNLYGTMAFDGAGGYGTAFRIDLTGPTLETIHDFVLDFENGLLPHAPLITGSDGAFYGTTRHGGLNDQGTVFQMDADGNLSTLHSFAFGTEPRSPLIEADADFYGVTSEGGSFGFGTVFQMSASGELTTLHSFDGRDGDTPMGALLMASDGNLYGTTQEGGPAGDAGPGVVFRLTASAVAVNAISPSSGPAAGAALTLLGGGFEPGAAATVGGETLTSVNVIGPTFLYGTTQALPPGTLHDVSLQNPGSSPTAPAATLAKAFFADFLDVPQNDIFHDYVETVFRAGITAGCGSGNYCRNAAVTRVQMAVFLLKAKHGAAYVPPACAGTFDDVVCPGQFTGWIEQLAAEGITGGCGGNNYCPADPVTRAQTAVFLLKTEHGSSHVPPGCGGIFGDVACPSLFADWIEELHGESVTGGCQASPLLYCPGSSSTRGQMAVFLVKTFGSGLSGP